jgi:hypothetical protein
VFLVTLAAAVMLTVACLLLDPPCDLVSFSPGSRLLLLFIVVHCCPLLSIVVHCCPLLSIVDVHHCACFLAKLHDSFNLSFHSFLSFSGMG